MGLKDVCEHNRQVKAEKRVELKQLAAKKRKYKETEIEKELGENIITS